MPDGRTQGVEIIGYDSASGTYTVHSYDSSGNTDVMHASVANDTWTFEGKSLRFTGGFRDGGDTLAGIWEQRRDEGAPWVHWMDVTLSKTNYQVESREGQSNTDEDVGQMSREQLVADVKRLRQGIRQHRDSTGHELCWHHPALWGLLPEATDPLPTVPDWPEFLRGCIRYRQSLDEQARQAPRTSEPFRG